jgi:hypothetical protein
MRPPARRPVRGLLSAAAAVLLAASLIQAVSVSAGAAADEPARFKVVRAQVFTVPGVGTVAIGMPSKRTVKMQRLDPSDGTWSRPEVIFNSGPRRTCGEINGATSPGGIALLIECDGSYSEDQAPTKTQALVSRDLETWAGHQVPGESYRPPGISPSGNYAVWAAYGGSDVYTWGADEGFRLPLRPVGNDYDTGDLAFLVDDHGTFTVAGVDNEAKGCVIGLYSRTLAGVTGHQQVDIAPGNPTGCSETGVYGSSSTRITGGPYVGRPGRWVVARPDESSPWALVARAPSQAPGLEEYRGPTSKTMYVEYSDVVGQPLLALGSPDRQHVTVQAYDDQAQTWGPTNVVYDHGFPGCVWDGSATARFAVHNLLLHCYPKRRASGHYPPRDGNFNPAPAHATTALLSIDGQTWKAFKMGARPVTSSPDRFLVAAGRATSTTIVSPKGFATVAAGAPGRCEAVVPIGQKRLLRLNATGGSKGFPTQLQRLTSSGWKTVHQIDLRAEGRCLRVGMADYGVPGTFYFEGTGYTRQLRIVRTEHGWRAQPTRGY